MIYTSLFFSILVFIIYMIDNLLLNKNNTNLEKEKYIFDIVFNKAENILNQEVIYYIGRRAPKLTNFELDEVIDKFIYYFSFLSCYSIENIDIELIKKEFKHTIKTLESRKGIKLNNEHIWWVLVLDYIRFLGTRQDLLYLVVDTTSCLINKIDTLSIKELSLYANILNNSIYSEIGEGLRIRPLLINEIDSESLQDNEYFKKWLLCSDDIINIIKNKFNMGDFSNRLLERELNLLDKLNFEFSEWDIFYEIFLSHVVAILSPSEDEDICCHKFDLEDLEMAVTITLTKLIKSKNIKKENIDEISKNIAKFMYNI